MIKKRYRFQVTVEPLDLVEQGRQAKPPLSFEVSNHDNILAVARRLCAGTHFDETSATSLAVGLKLMTEVMLANRDDPLFSELKPAVVHFMKKLKAQIKDQIELNASELPSESMLSQETLLPEHAFLDDEVQPQPGDEKNEPVSDTEQDNGIELTQEVGSMDIELSSNGVLPLAYEHELAKP